jgi:hypothetical protein
MVPPLLMPPEKVEIGWAALFAKPTRIPVLADDEISPPLEMPPAKVEMLPASMPTPPADIVPVLAIPPEKVETG